MKTGKIILLLATLLGFSALSSRGDVIDTFSLTAGLLEDTYLDQGNPTTKYETDFDLEVGKTIFTDDTLFFILRWDTTNFKDSLGAGSIQQVDFFFYVEVSGSDSMWAYALKKPWTEADATYNEWERKDWGVLGARDIGETWNNSDGSGDDHSATVAGRGYIGSTGWLTFNISDTAWISSIVAGTDTSEGYIFIAEDGHNTITATEEATNQPYMRVIYSTSVGQVIIIQ